MRLGLFFKFVVSKTRYHKAIITTTKFFLYHLGVRFWDKFSA